MPASGPSLPIFEVPAVAFNVIPRQVLFQNEYNFPPRKSVSTESLVAVTEEVVPCQFDQ